MQQGKPWRVLRLNCREGCDWYAAMCVPYVGGVKSTQVSVSARLDILEMPVGSTTVSSSVATMGGETI